MSAPAHSPHGPKSDAQARDPAIGHDALMDRIYAQQRHIYDATRRYYLLGRDPMLAGLQPPPGGKLLEIGCGTGRNLIAAARQYPNASFYGFDISSQMLETAQNNVDLAHLGARIMLAQADASGFNPMNLFGQENFDRVFISYAVSMIPPWHQTIAQAWQVVAPGGSLHVVDFGDCAQLPGVFRAGLRRWLAAFHVTPRTDLEDVMRAGVAHTPGAALTFARTHRGYVQTGIARRPG